jgi:hypothetical protein
MANICRTEIHVHANMSTIDWFEKLVKDFSTEDYIGQFSGEGESMIDKIGSKWLTKYDWYREDDNEYFLSIESAWYPPDVFLKEMYKQVAEHDSGAYLSGRYWDEAFSPIGIFEVNSTGYHTAETDLDVDMDEEYFWDEQVEPAFNNLEL